MSDKGESKFGIAVEKIWEGRWSFGICLSKTPDEFYLYIMLFKWEIAIGKLWKEMTVEE